MVAVALVAATVSGAMAGPASAGELVYKGCIAAESPIHNDKKVCKEAGPGRMFASPFTLALSPDGQSLYTGSGVACDGQTVYCSAIATVGRFDRDSAAGSLDYRDCVTGVESDGPQSVCTQIPDAAPGAVGAGLGDVQSLLVSPDGRSMYAASPNPICGDYECEGGNALARFDRDPATGAITYRGCITGDERSGPSGSGACSEIPGATAEGDGTGIDGLQSLALSADGESLYTAAASGDSIARFDRDPETGALTYRGCITGDRQWGPSGSGACAQIPTATEFGTGSGLGSAGEFLGHIPAAPYPVVVSSDGKSVYVGAAGDQSIAQFDRDRATGALAYVGCIASEGSRVGRPGAPCTEIPAPVSVESLVMSPDGKFMYAGGIVREHGGRFVSGIAQFRRSAATGALTYLRTVKGQKGESLALSGNGESLYTGSGIFRRVSQYHVTPGTGRPSYAGCLTGDKTEKSCTPIRTATGRGLDSGLEKVGELAAIGRTLYAYSSSGQNHDIARFAIAPETWIGKVKTRGHRAVFKFRANPFSKFECKLKGKRVKRKLRHWRHCGSHGLHRDGRQVYRHLRPGKKVVRVRATDRSRTTDPTPAKRRFHIH